VRLDQTKSPQFQRSQQWETIRGDFEFFVPVDPKKPTAKQKSNSFSGKERNRLFLQTEDNFDDVSLVSGADLIEDCRGFAWLDFDHDGWLDLAITSPMSPRFRLLRNTIGDDTAQKKSVSVSLVGGNDETNASTELSAKDAIGSTLIATVDGTKRAFQLSKWEGLATQNSKWIHVGMGDAEKIERLEVFWPSGKSTVYKNIETGTRVTFFEDGAPSKFEAAEKSEP